MKRRLLLALFAITTIGTAAAKGDCISECLAGKDCSLNYSGACSSALSDCSVVCTGSRGPAFGAIAYGKTSGAFGYSYQFADAEAAADFAMKNCAEGGDDCEVAVTFEDACAALAVGKKDGEATATAIVASSETDAKSRALADCTAGDAEGCEIAAWSCSFP